MTCIVGVIDKKEDKVLIGGDSAGVGGYDVTIRKDVKVFKVGDFVIGCTTSFRMIQLIRFSFSPPKRHPDTDIYKYMCTEFINELRRCFKDGGYAEKEKEAERGGRFLVGYGNRLFKIDDDYQVGESMDGFDACGCGAVYSLGALKAMDESGDVKERVERSLEIAVHFSAGVRPPFVFEST
jgi:ATP-dependent protease HslVU (ClpYQ) peptidase subunit